MVSGRNYNSCRMARLRVTSDSGEEKYDLSAGALTVGRGLESEVRLKDIKASRRHCQILKTPGGYKCLDLSSGNGTFINGVQIKEQKLNPGDKIQIGSTTLTFEVDGAEAARPAAAKPTAAKPVAARPATGAVPAARKPVTSAAPKVKKPVTAAVAKARKTTTGRVPVTGKTGGNKLTSAPTKITGRVRKGTQAIGKGRKGTGRPGFGSASQKFHQDARKPKVNQFKVVIIGIGVVFFGVVLFILFGLGENPEVLRSQVDTLTKQGHKLQSDGDLAGAIAKYEEAIARARGKEGYKQVVIELESFIKALTEDIKILKEIEAKYREYKSRFEGENLDRSGLNDLRKDVKALKTRVERSEATSKEEIGELLVRVEKALEDVKDREKNLRFQTFMNKSMADFKINEKGEQLWGAAITSWNEKYLSQPEVTDEDRVKAKERLERLGFRSVEDSISCIKRAKRYVEDNRTADAIDYLKTQQPRFVGSGEAEDKMAAAIKDLDR